jgi:hypothetical protein
MSRREKSKEELFEEIRKTASKATDDDILNAIEAGNVYHPDVYGRFPWDRSERRGKIVGMSKASLGNFVYAVLSCGGDITNFFCLQPSYRNASVYVRVHLSMKQKSFIEETTEYRFDPPPVISVS